MPQKHRDLKKNKHVGLHQIEKHLYNKGNKQQNEKATLNSHQGNYNNRL